MFLPMVKNSGVVVHSVNPLHAMESYTLKWLVVFYEFHLNKNLMNQIMSLPCLKTSCHCYFPLSKYAQVRTARAGSSLSGHGSPTTRALRRPPPSTT